MYMLHCPSESLQRVASVAILCFDATCWLPSCRQLCAAIFFFLFVKLQLVFTASANQFATMHNECTAAGGGDAPSVSRFFYLCHRIVANNCHRSTGDSLGCSLFLMDFVFFFFIRIFSIQFESIVMYGW